jgi:hypothetical protein
METKLFVEALCSELISLVNIDDLPSLVGIVVLISVSRVDNDCLTFLILFVFDFNDLVVGWVDKVLTLEHEYLEPSRVG